MSQGEKKNKDACLIPGSGINGVMNATRLPKLSLSEPTPSPPPPPPLPGKLSKHFSGLTAPCLLNRGWSLTITKRSKVGGGWLSRSVAPCVFSVGTGELPCHMK